jgi:hypothetical protein
MGPEVFVVALIIVSVVAAILVIVARDRSRRNDEGELSRVWAAYARAQGMELIVPEGEWPNRSVPRLVGAGVEIVAVREGEALVTRVEMRPPETVLGRLLVTTEGAGTELPRAPIERQTMSAELYVFALPASFAERVLTEEVARALSAFRMGGWMRLEYEKGRIALEWRGGELNAARLDEARRLIARVSGAMNEAFRSAKS